MPWQRGCLITISSLSSLYEDVVNDFKMKFYLTSRVNQDVLESTFSVFRRLGGTYTNPTALNFVRRMKSYLLGSCSDVIVETAAVKWEQGESAEDDDAFVLTAELGQGLNLEPASMTGKAESMDVDEETLQHDPLQDHDYLDGAGKLNVTINKQQLLKVVLL